MDIHNWLKNQSEQRVDELVMLTYSHMWYKLFSLIFPGKQLLLSDEILTNFVH